MSNSNIIVGEYTTEESYYLCDGGLFPARIKSVQNKVCTNEGFFYLTALSTQTTFAGDFVCKNLMLLMSFIAALIFATGGGALAILVAAGVGAASAVAGGFICGVYASVARIWITPKNTVLISNMKPVTSRATMYCPIFQEEIKIALYIKNWWQAVLVGGSNVVIELLKCAIAGSTIAGLRILLTKGISSVFFNAVNNWFYSLTTLKGVLVRLGAGGIQYIQETYVGGRKVNGGEKFARGMWSPELGTANAMYVLANHIYRQIATGSSHYTITEQYTAFSFVAGWGAGLKNGNEIRKVDNIDLDLLNKSEVNSKNPSIISTNKKSILHKHSIEKPPTRYITEDNPDAVGWDKRWNSETEDWEKVESTDPEIFPKGRRRFVATEEEINSGMITEIKEFSPKNPIDIDICKKLYEASTKQIIASKNDPAPQTVIDFETKVAYAGREYLQAFTQGGEAITKILVGGKSMVAALAKYYYKLKNLIITHNHPGERHPLISFEDWDLGAWQKVYEMRARGEMSTSSMRRGPNGWKSNNFTEKMAEKLYEDAKKEIDKKTYEGMPSQEEWSIINNIHTKMLEGIAKKIGGEYNLYVDEGAEAESGVKEK